jgi:hypothetical protein
MAESLPDGWRIEAEFDPGIAVMDGHYRYHAYRWATWTEKKWFREPVVKTGWRHAGYSSRWRDETVGWIQDTAKMMRGTG